MFSSIIAALKEFFGATKAVSTEITQRDAEKNTTSQQSNATAASLQKVRDQAVAAEQNPDQTDINRMTGE